jgi:predicted membrane-bound mannosyltransferase
VVLTFAEYDNDRHGYVYAHTSRDILQLVNDIRTLQEQNPGSAIAVTSSAHFPLSWYLREYRVGYHGRPIATSAPLVVGSAAQREALDASLGNRYERIGIYRLRPGARLILYARRDLRRAPMAPRER